jgi:hypothetical protein
VSASRPFQHHRRSRLIMWEPHLSHPRESSNEDVSFFLSECLQNTSHHVSEAEHLSHERRSRLFFFVEEHIHSQPSVGPQHTPKGAPLLTLSYLYSSLPRFILISGMPQIILFKIILASIDFNNTVFFTTYF